MLCNLAATEGLNALPDMYGMTCYIMSFQMSRLVSML